MSFIRCEDTAVGAKVGAMTAPDAIRSFPPPVTDEQTLLDGWLDYYRAAVLHKCAGLSPDQLVHRSCPPSTMSLIGLVRHLTEMERVYVHRLTEPDLPLHYATDDSPDADFDDIDPPQPTRTSGLSPTTAPAPGRSWPPYRSTPGSGGPTYT